MSLRHHDNFVIARQRMVESLVRSGIKCERTLSAMMSLPRHTFVSEALRYRAYEITSLPIGFSQTISSPLTVARMIEACNLKGCESVLEIGTGSGYQCALLAKLASSVESQERIPELYSRARKLLLFDMNLRNVKLHLASGFDYQKSYDAILFACAPSKLPDGVLHLLKERGVMILPVGDGSSQVLKRYVRISAESVVEDTICPASFVPFVRKNF